MKELTATMSINTATSMFDMNLTPKEQDLPPTTGLFEARIGDSRTLILIPKTRLAQSLLWDWLGDCDLGFSLKGHGFDDKHRVRVTEGQIEFRPPKVKAARDDPPPKPKPRKRGKSHVR